MPEDIHINPEVFLPLTTSTGRLYARPTLVRPFNLHKNLHLEVEFNLYVSDVKGFALNLPFINEDSLNFLRVLKKHNRLVSHPEPLTKKIIKKITLDCELDSDLLEDIYECNEIYHALGTLENSTNYHLKNVSDVEKQKFKKYSSKKIEIGENVCEKRIKSRVSLEKYYIYMRRCAILYRQTKYKNPFLELRKFLEQNKKELTAQLMVEAIAYDSDNWNSGLHEWLTREQTLVALDRTAAYQIAPDIEPCLEECIGYEQTDEGLEKEYYYSEFNWLDLQFLLRTPTKYTIYINPDNTITDGHIKSVCLSPNAIGNIGSCSTGTQKQICKKSENPGQIVTTDISKDLNLILAKSRTVRQYMSAILYKFNYTLFTVDSEVIPHFFQKYLVDGTKTNDLEGLKKFQNKFLKHQKEFMENCEWHISIHEIILHQTRGLDACYLRANQNEMIYGDSASKSDDKAVLSTFYLNFFYQKRAAESQMPDLGQSSSPIFRGAS